jgi:hypothetical protein
MGIGTRVFVIALGAILTFAVETDSTEGINVNSVGIVTRTVVERVEAPPAAQPPTYDVP